jgi:hypothetical protein
MILENASDVKLFTLTDLDIAMAFAKGLTLNNNMIKLIRERPFPLYQDGLINNSQ